MALAYLFSELNRARRDSDFEIPRLELNAFIVDHKARENSRNEAAEVSQWLSDLGNLLILSTYSTANKLWRHIVRNFVSSMARWYRSIPAS